MAKFSAHNYITEQLHSIRRLPLTPEAREARILRVEGALGALHEAGLITTDQYKEWVYECHELRGPEYEQ